MKHYIDRYPQEPEEDTLEFVRQYNEWVLRWAIERVVFFSPEEEAK